MNLCCDEQTLGADPLYFKWQVVRGDTSSISFEFYEDNEVDLIDISEWTFAATAYDPTNETSYTLDVIESDGIVTVSATAETTSDWGTGIRSQVAELNFDLQGTRDDGVVWTPAIGIIKVLGDVTIGGSI